MIEIRGNWFDGRSSRQTPATLRVAGSGDCSLHVGDRVYRGRIRDWSVSPRLGDTPRRLTLATGEALETTDNHAVDRMLAEVGERSGGHRRHAVLHMLENRWGTVVLMVAATALLAWLFVSYAMPALSQGLADAIPGEFIQGSDAQSLAMLDGLFFEDSRLDQARQDGLRERLLAATPDLYLPVNIEFRRGGNIVGANALALHGGTILFTDELVELAGNDEQLQTIYGHELGHLQHRHALRRVIQNSLINAVLIFVLGDASGIPDLVGGDVFGLADLAWTRELEREADDYALAYMREHDLAPQHFADALKRLECSHRTEPGDDHASEEFLACLDEEPGWEDDDFQWTFYLSTHPATSERIERFTNPPTDQSRARP